MRNYCNGLAGPQSAGSHQFCSTPKTIVFSPVCLENTLMSHAIRRRVLLALGWYDYRLHRGIEKYAQEHGWHLSEDVAREKVIPWGWDGDGILAWLGAGDDLADFVVQTKKPTVDFSFRRPELKFARILEDTEETARQVADHFLSHGFRNYLFYSDASNWIYDERGSAFLKVLGLAGRNAQWLRWHGSPAYCTDRKAWKRKRNWLATELKRATKPVALFAASDGLALEVLETCETAGIAVPEHVAIIGAGNSLLAVDAMHTPISSVDTSYELMGYRGAELLAGLMKGKPAPIQPVRVPVTGLIARKSSDLVAVNHPGVAKGFKYLLNHFHEPIGVDDLAGAAAMSRRGFHQAFVEYVGHPPGQELQRVRIDHAKKLLAQTDEKLNTIGELCGYQSANSFWYAFKMSAGISPQEYRKKSVS